MEGKDGERIEGKGKWGKGNPGKVEGGEEQEKGDQQKFPFSSSSSKLLRFFSKSDSSFTGNRWGPSGGGPLGGPSVPENGKLSCQKQQPSSNILPTKDRNF